MRHKKLFVCVLVLLLECCGLSIFSASATAEANLPPEQWVGQTFLFHALPADRQAEGYEVFKVEDAERGWGGDRLVRLPYVDHVYKRVIVTNVISFPAGDKLTEYLIYMKEKSTGIRLVGRTMRGQLEGLLLESDLIQARKQFLGKKIYLNKRYVQVEYNPANEASASQFIPVQIGTEAQVVDIYTGVRTDEPICLVIMINGQRAILPLAYSWSNIRVSAWKQTLPWQTELFTENPRSAFGWPQEVWDNIDAGIVKAGMTARQVELSWGVPVDIIKNSDGSGNTVWHYDDSSLTFSNDCLLSVEAKHN